MAEKSHKLIIGILSVLLITCLLVIATILLGIPAFNKYIENKQIEAQKQLIKGLIDYSKNQGVFTISFEDQSVVLYEEDYLKKLAQQ